MSLAGSSEFARLSEMVCESVGKECRSCSIAKWPETLVEPTTKHGGRGTEAESELEESEESEESEEEEELEEEFEHCLTKGGTEVRTT